jgi:long-chain fatty acid transport protein
VRKGATAIAIAIALASFDARASGFDAPQIGSAQSGPVTADPAAIWWNPAQLGYLDRAELELGVGLIVGSVSYARQRRGTYQFADNLDFAEPIDPADLDPSRTGGADKVRAIPVGPGADAFFAIPAIRDRLVFGLGASIPYVAVLNWPKGGPQRFAGQSIFLATPHLSFAAAVKAHDVISLGASVSYVLGTMNLSKVQDFGALDTFGDSLARDPIGQENDFGTDAPSTVRELDVLARPVSLTKMIAHGVTFNAGIALRPTKKLSLALVYHHGANMHFKGRFRLDMDDEFFTQDLAAQGLQYPPIVTGKAEIRLRLPKRITLGAGYRIHERFQLDGYVSYVFYSDFDRVRIRFVSPDLAQPALGVGSTVDQDLVRDWKGTVLAEVNGRIFATKKTLASVTLGYQSPASPPSTVDAVSPDGHRIIVGAGMQHRFNDRFALLVDAEGQFIVPRTITGSDHDLANGTYNMSIFALTLHGRIFFGVRGAKVGKAKREAAPAPAPAPAQEPAAAPPATPVEAPTTAPPVPADPEPTAPDAAPAVPPVPPPPPPAPPPTSALSTASNPSNSLVFAAIL